MNFKFFYQDDEGDIISINSQEDYLEAIEGEPSMLKLIIATNANEAKFFLPIVEGRVQEESSGDSKEEMK